MPSEMVRYINNMKKLVASSSSNRLLPKVLKLVKNRVQLYQVLQDMYEEFVQIYQTCKEGERNNPSEHGLRLFDEASYKYVLMLYQYRNRTRAETE